jgi:hypothetical protein
MKKLVVGTSLALVLASTSAFAAAHHSRVMEQPYGSDAYAAATNSDAVTGGPAVVSNGKYLGWDPDTTIQLQLLRQGDESNAGGN